MVVDRQELARNVNRNLRLMLGVLPAEVREPAVLKTAFEVVHDIQLAVYTGGWGTPRRVDTARYVSAWRLAGADLGLGSLGDTSQAQAGDGHATVETMGGETLVVLSNSVEYASFVEYGTRYMRPGNHVAVALQRATQNLEEAFVALLEQAWGDLWR